LPEEGDRYQRQNTSVNDNNIRPSQKSFREVANQGLELCRAHCEIHGVEEAIQFCHSLYDLNQPEICRRMASPPQIPINASFMTTNSDDDSEEESYIEPETVTTTTIRTPLPRTAGAHLMVFDVKLKINSVYMAKDPWGGRDESAAAAGYCLYLPIAEVAFDDQVRGLSLSCHTNFLLRQCYIRCPNNTALNRQLEAIQEEEELLDAMNFWMYGSLVVIAWIAMSVVESLADAMCFQTLGE
jgi:hypothetical protein